AAKAVVDHAGKSNASVQNLEEIKGHGMKGNVNGREVLAGNVKLLQKYNVAVDDEVLRVVDTIVVVAVDKKLAGYIVIADEIKEDSKQAIQLMHSLGIKTVMLSGDKQEVVDRVAKELNIDLAFGNLLPENKVEKVEEIKKGKKEALAFVGDGINDAPVLAISDVGIAMGGLGS